MSEPERAWHFYIDDMISFAERVLEYTKGLDQAGFASNTMIFDATVRNLELIGEAVTHIPETVRQMHPAIPWRQLVATRNRLIHEYLGIDNDILWSIIRDDVPTLVSLLKALHGRSV